MSHVFAHDIIANKVSYQEIAPSTYAQNSKIYAYIIIAKPTFHTWAKKN